MIQYKRNSEMTSKSSDFSTAFSYASISDDSDASSFVSLVVEGLTGDLASPPIPREVVHHPETSSLFYPNYQAEAEFSMDI